MRVRAPIRGKWSMTRAYESPAARAEALAYYRMLDMRALRVWTCYAGDGVTVFCAEYWWDSERG